MKEIEPGELATYNGKNGSPAYVVHRGSVYDLSASKLWKDGTHMRIHHAGMDLTAAIAAAPHSPDVLERYPRVGVFGKERDQENPMPQPLARLLARFPLLRRHPHPMTVHFPIVFMFSATAFTLLYLLTGLQSFESTALHCLAAGILFILPAATTGYFTWWLNYGAHRLRPVTIKISFTLILLVIGVIAFIWRLSVPDILSPFRFASAVYLLLVCSLLPLVTVIGWFGAGLTFPIARD